jgi:hypothetical protein
MKRARHPVPTTLKGYLHHNPATGFYEITEDEITYHLTLQQTVLLKQYFHDHTGETPSPEGWYNSLSKEERKKVYRTGVEDNTEYFNDGNHLD